MAEVEFLYNGIRIIIQCSVKCKMKEICQKFKQKLNLNNNLNIFYSYNGKIGFDGELSFEELANSEDKFRNKMNILVYDIQTIKNNSNNIIKSKNIICPICKENIKMNIKDYKINLYECQNEHKFENILLNEFEELQNIDLLDIICDICKKCNKCISYNNVFYKCLTCKNDICPLCKSNHDDKHKIINYDDKYYICNKHNENYISYCEECKINICTLCEVHKNHKRINFIDILPKKMDLIEKINNLKYFINLFNNDINRLLKLLNEVKDKMNMYYKIHEDMINNYDNKNRNYELLYNLNQFQNDNIIDEIQKVIEDKTMIDKFNEIFNIYRKMNIDEINLIYKVKDLKNVQLFGEYFVEKNKNNCNLIIEGKEQELKQYYSFGYFFGTDKEYFELKLNGITNITNMSYMFNGCKALVSLPDIHRWNTNTVYNMECLFGNCESLLSLPDIGKWDTSSVINMKCMFENCQSLISLPDISKWDTSNVSDMFYMFENCQSLISFPDISKWDTSNVNDMTRMFSRCISLNLLPDISKWDISKVNNMNKMFYKCKKSLKIPFKFT